MHAPDEGTNERRALVVVALLVLLAAALRLRGIGFLLPQRIAQDEILLVSEAQHLRGEEPNSGPLHPYGGYPNFLSRLAATLPASRASSADRLAPGASLDERLAEAAAPWLEMRIVVALMSALIVPGTWLLGRRLLGSRWALVAAALTAVSVLDVWFSQQARPHGPAAVLDLFAVLFAMRMRERPSAAAYLLVGLSLAIAVGCLQSGLAVLPPILVAFLMRRRDAGAAPRAWALVVPGMLLVTFPLFYWFLFEDHPVAGSRSSGLDGSELYLTGHRLLLADFDGTGFLSAARSLWSYEPVIALAALLALAVGSWRLRQRGLQGLRSRPDLAIALAFVLPYVLVIGAYHRTYQRFLLPLLPYLACLVACFLRTVAGRIGPRLPDPSWRRLAVGSWVLLPIGLESFASWKLVSIRASPDTLTMAAGWITSHLRPEADRIFVLPRMDLPLLQSSHALVENEPHALRILPWSWHQLHVPPEARAPEGYDLLWMPMSPKARLDAANRDPEGYLRALGGDYAVIEVYDDWGWGGLPGLRLALQRITDRVARFSPSGVDTEDEVGLEYQDYPGRINRSVAWTWRVLHADRAGPIVEIYRFRK